MPIPFFGYWSAGSHKYFGEYPIGIAFRCGYVEVPEEYSLEIGKWRAASFLSKEYTAKEIGKFSMSSLISVFKF